MKNQFLKAFRLSTTIRPQILTQKRELQKASDDRQIPKLVARLDTLLKRNETIQPYLKM